MAETPLNAREAVVREYSPGELLCRQGAVADRMFLLKAGAIRATVVTDKALVEADEDRLRRGHEVEVTRQPVLVGLEGALLGHYLTSLVAAETSVVVEIPGDTRAVMSLVGDKPEIGLALARVLARRLMSANKSLGSVQRTASRFMRDLQGLCTDFCNLVQRISEDAGGEDDVIRALSAAKRTWAYNCGESGGAEVARNTRVLMARVVDDRMMVGKQHRLKAGDLLCRKGDPGNSVYLLVSGRMSVRIGNEVFGTVRPGETVGELGVLLGEAEPKRMADIVADEPSVVGVIPNDAFPDLVRGQPKLLINLCRMMCLRVKSFEQLSADSDDVLRAVAARFAGQGGGFEADAGNLRDALERLVEENQLPLQMELEQLTVMIERWRAKMDELAEKIPAASR